MKSQLVSAILLFAINCVGLNTEIYRLGQSKSDLTAQFKDIRNRFNGRYVRLYGACDRNGFYDDVIDAAWSAGVGVHALIWVSFALDAAQLPKLKTHSAVRV